MKVNMDIEKRIENILKGKEVLEVGGLGDFERYVAEDFKSWRHLRIKDSAKNIKGIDINSKCVKFAQSKGFDYRVADIEDENSLNELGQFEVVLLLDVIEHLSNVGVALTNIKKLIQKGGSLIITTPNPVSLNKIWRVLANKQLNEFNDHTCNIQLSHFKQLFLRTDITFKDFEYFTFPDENSKTYLKSKIIDIAGKMIPLFNTHLFVLGKMESK